jgi:hypothetical protein
MPIAFSASQLRAICAPTASSTSTSTRMRPFRLRRTAKPRQSPVVRRRERTLSPATAPAATATQSTADHQGRPSGPSSVNDVRAARVASMARIGTSAASRAPARGHWVGAVRRSAAIRAATPSCPLRIPASPPIADAWKTPRRQIVDPAASTHRRHASLRASSATSWSATAATRNHAGADSRAPKNTSRRDAMTVASTATAAIGSPTANARRHAYPVPLAGGTARLASLHCMSHSGSST